MNQSYLCMDLVRILLTLSLQLLKEYPLLRGNLPNTKVTVAKRLC